MSYPEHIKPFTLKACSLPCVDFVSVKLEGCGGRKERERKRERESYQDKKRLRDK